MWGLAGGTAGYTEAAGGEREKGTDEGWGRKRACWASGLVRGEEGAEAKAG